MRGVLLGLLCLCWAALYGWAFYHAIHEDDRV